MAPSVPGIDFKPQLAAVFRRSSRRVAARSRRGSTVRIDQVRSRPGAYAMYFHGRTRLVDSFRRYPETFAFGGNRAIVLDADEPVPVAALRRCISAALTYRLPGGRR